MNELHFAINLKASSRCLASLRHYKILFLGNWSDWKDWEKCDTSCGNGGKQKRRRVCDDPKPKPSGKCLGSTEETREPCGPAPPLCPGSNSILANVIQGIRNYS